jgi:hypothetical protein
MNKAFIIVLLSLFSLNSTAREIESTITYGIGERNTTVDWNIAGNVNGYLNPTSELTWKNIKSKQVSLGGIWTEGDYFLQASGEYGKVYSGENQDSDWAIDKDSNEMVVEFSRSNNNAGKGYMADLELNYGKSHAISPKLRIDTSLGYSSHRQHLKMYEGFQSISEPGYPAVPKGSFDDLDSLYEANWSGPQANIGINYKNSSDVYALNYTYQDIDLNGYTNWNLRSNLKHPVSMTQIGGGKGKKITASYEHAVSNFSTLSLMLSKYKYKAKGVHTYHELSSDIPVELNAVNWKANDIKLIYRSLF